jgi:hypothetical protein
MDVEIIHHQHNRFCLRIVDINQIPHKRGKIDLGASGFGFHEAFSPQGFTRQKDTAKPLALIFIILAFDLACLHG